MSTQLERSLQSEIAWRLKALPVVSCAIPNGVYIPSRDPAERDIAARIVKRMKAEAMLTPGAPDMVIAGRYGCVMVELKRPRTHDLFVTRPKGVLSPVQKEFKARCERAGVRYCVAYDWDDVDFAIAGLF